MLKIEGLSAAYHKGNPVLHGLNLTVFEGDQLVILGSNGAGKTTFANCFFGLVPHVSGNIEYNGIELISYPVFKVREIGLSYFMQGAPVFPQMTVKQNLTLATTIAADNELNSFIEEARLTLPVFQSKHIDGVPAGTLSGGERTQLALLMVLKSKPSLLILDEPFAGLSESSAASVLRVLHGYAAFSSASMILIAQDKKLAGDFSTSQYILENGKLKTI